MKLFSQSFGTGTPIIVVHGGPGLDHAYFLPQMLELAKDHQLIFYDQRGSGKSLETELSPELMNVNQFIQDLEDLRKDLGLNSFVLLGHSWGGELAMHYAVTYPESISALILMRACRCRWLCCIHRSRWTKNVSHQR
jgi:proline iminopeptidase